jgi:uncharacterized protein with FMN-binding domain
MKEGLCMKKFLISAVCLVVVAAMLLGGKYIYDLVSYRRIMEAVVIQTPDISQIQNGCYNGFFDAVFISADVDVFVENHRITEIIINNHYNDRGSSGEAIIIDVIENQSLEIDTVSGATNSSLVILKAIQNALESGIN